MTCPTIGVGPSHGCAEKAFCYVFDKDDGHYCTRTCDTDADCAAVNPALVCQAHGGGVGEQPPEEVKSCNLPH